MPPLVMCIWTNAKCPSASSNFQLHIPLSGRKIMLIINTSTCRQLSRKQQSLHLHNLDDHFQSLLLRHGITIPKIAKLVSEDPFHNDVLGANRVFHRSANKQRHAALEFHVTSQNPSLLPHSPLHNASVQLMGMEAVPQLELHLASLSQRHD